MSFLQPMLLIALPVIALPIVIHLINQRRYQTVRWGAMRFLFAANRMSRGYARLRQWIILLFRVLALAGLVFMASRPLASGWVGLAAGGRPDTTMVLLDRSPSMQEVRAGSAGSKLETGRQQLVRALNTLGSAGWVLIENTTNQPIELESPEQLLRLPAAGPASAPADLPAMLQAAQDYIRSNKPGRTEVWLCSDMRENDWSPADPRWPALRDTFAASSQGVRFHLLGYPESAPENVALRITGVRHRQTGDSAELLVSLRLTRGTGGLTRGTGAAGDTKQADGQLALKSSIPIRFEIEGARSEITVELAGPQVELKDHRIPLGHNRERGWGRVSIPADANPSDNDFYFVFDRPEPRRTVIVAEDGAASLPLQAAASSSPDPAVPCAVETAAPGQLSTLEWEKISLLLWQAPLPAGEAAKAVEEFAGRGGSVIFFPPRVPTSDTFAGVQWTSWKESDDRFGIATWRGDGDLLARTQSGGALPVGQLEVKRYCGLAGEHTPLAVLSDGGCLLGKGLVGKAPLGTTPGGHENIYFCATTALPSDSSLTSSGVVLYVMVQRAIAAGSARLGDAFQLAAGDPSGASSALPSSAWKQLAGAANAISAGYEFHAGVYSAGEKLLAVNAPEAEEEARVVGDGAIAGLFRGLDFARVDDQAGNTSGLIEEIWRPFLLAMIIALVGEAVLCLPRIRPAADAQPGAAP